MREGRSLILPVTSLPQTHTHRPDPPMASSLIFGFSKCMPRWTSCSLMAVNTAARICAWCTQKQQPTRTDKPRLWWEQQQHDVAHHGSRPGHILTKHGLFNADSARSGQTGHAATRSAATLRPRCSGQTATAPPPRPRVGCHSTSHPAHNIMHACRH